MTKSIRKEIEKLKRDPETITDDLVKLFRSWALGCIGKDEVIYDRHHYVSRGRNQAKQAIREKIEEANNEKS